MIMNNQILSLTEDELSYLYYCLNAEWDALNMKYPFDWYILKCFRNESLNYILNKYKENLTENHKSIIINILNKLNN